MGPTIRRGISGIVSQRLDLGIIIALTAIAAVARLIFLETLPNGFHNDEGWTGIHAQQVLDGSIRGPYTAASGEPAGPLYLVALLLKLFGNTILTVRLPMALFGIVTVPVAFLTFRTMFDRPTAVFGALLLALGVWHLHYSRLGFMAISWPLLEVVALLFFFHALKRGHWALFALAGLATGAGVYTYGAYLMFLLPLGLVVVWAGAREPSEARARYARNIALMVACAVFAALPMILYAIDPDHDYFGHQQGLSLTNTAAWKDAGLAGRIDLTMDRGRDFFARAFWSGTVDGTDGAGATALVDRVTLAIMAAGLATLAWRWRSPASVAVLLMIALLPLTTIFTIDPAYPVYGLYRRALGMVPFLAVLAAVPLAAWWTRTARLPDGWRELSYGTIASVVLVIILLNLNSYFREFRHDDVAQLAFPAALTDASLYMEDLPGDPYVLFYSDRWGFSNETRVYLAPERAGEDRSEQYGEYSLERPGAGNVVYVFLDNYIERAAEVQQLYPGGDTHTSLRDDGSVVFTAYLLADGEGVVSARRN